MGELLYLFSVRIDHVTVRLSPAILIFQVVLATFGVSIVFTFVSMVELSEAWFGAGVGDLLRDDAIFFVLSASLEAVITISLFLRWSAVRYDIKDDELVHARGILWRQRHIHSLKDVQTVFVSQGILGRIFSFGTITLHNPLLRGEITLRHIADPERSADVLRSVLRHVKHDNIVPLR